MTYFYSLLFKDLTHHDRRQNLISLAKHISGKWHAVWGSTFYWALGLSSTSSSPSCAIWGKLISSSSWTFGVHICKTGIVMLALSPSVTVKIRHDGICECAFKIAHHPPAEMR